MNMVCYGMVSDPYFPMLVSYNLLEQLGHSLSYKYRLELELYHTPNIICSLQNATTKLFNLKSNIMRSLYYYKGLIIYLYYTLYKGHMPLL